MEAGMADKPRKATLFQVVRMLLWAFSGIRKREEHDKIEVTPVQVIIVGIIAGAIFVGTIVSVVQFITR
jgi:hypothetical protein